MSAYVITFIKKITNAPLYDEARRLGVASFHGTNATVRVMPGKLQVLEGEPLEMVAMVEFPTLEEAKAWYYSPSYQKVVQMRLEATECQTVMVEST